MWPVLQRYVAATIRRNTHDVGTLHSRKSFRPLNDQSAKHGAVVLTARIVVGAILACGTLVSLTGGAPGGVEAAEILVGGATAGITPQGPAARSGQAHTGFARSVDKPVTATALALEARDGDRVVDQAIMVSCDLLADRGSIQQQLRRRVKSELPEFDVEKLFLSFTYTHGAPVTPEGKYATAEQGVIRPAAHVTSLLKQLGDVVLGAWKSRKPGGVSWGLAREVEMLFFWDPDKSFTAIAVSVPCPSREVEGRSSVSADFWHDVRQQLHKKYSQDLHVLAWTGAAGKQSPHLRADERTQPKGGPSRTEEIAGRVVRAVDDVFQVAKSEIRTDVPMVHRVQSLRIPVHKVAREEPGQAASRHEALLAKLHRGSAENVRMDRGKVVVDRYRQGIDRPYYEAQLHVVRLGDVVIATNPFELFLDLSFQIKARSKAVQTFVIQSTGSSAIHMPTAAPVAGGGYGAGSASHLLGIEGEQVLLNHTVELINALWNGQGK